MPQASEELRAMFDDDKAAWEVLGSNFIDDRGIIKMKDKKDSAYTDAVFRY